MREREREIRATMLSYPSGLPPDISSCRSGKAQAAGSSMSR